LFVCCMFVVARGGGVNQKPIGSSHSHFSFVLRVALMLMSIRTRIQWQRMLAYGHARLL
jgi:hypothetical protein